MQTVQESSIPITEALPNWVAESLKDDFIWLNLAQSWYNQLPDADKEHFAHISELISQIMDASNKTKDIVVFMKSFDYYKKHYYNGLIGCYTDSDKEEFVQSQLGSELPLWVREAVDTDKAIEGLRQSPEYLFFTHAEGFTVIRIQEDLRIALKI